MTGKRQFRREWQHGETKRRTGKLRTRNAQLKKNKVSRGNESRILRVVSRVHRK